MRIDSFTMVGLSRFAAGAETGWKVPVLGRMLGLAMAVTLCVLARDLVLGLNPVVSLCAVAVSAGCLALLRRRPRLGTPITVGMFLALTGLTALATALNRDAGAAVLNLLILPAALSTLLLGPRAGAGITGLALACMAGLTAAFPPRGMMGVYRLVNEMLQIVFAFCITASLDATLQDCQARLQAAGRALHGVSESGLAMGRALFDELEPALAAMRAGLAAPEPSAQAVGRAAEGLAGRLKSARGLFQGQAPEIDAPVPVERLQRRTMLHTLGFLVAFHVLLTARNMVWGGLYASNAACTAALAAILAGVLLWPSRVTFSRAGALVMLAVCANNTVNFLHWGGTADSPSMVVAPTLAVFACLFCDTWVVAAVFALGVWMLLHAASRAHTPADEALLFYYGLLLVVLTVVGLSLSRLRRRYLDGLERQNRLLAEALRLRRRLAGTLFHDVNNQLATLEMGQTAQGWDMQALDEARGHCGRMADLIEASKPFMLNTDRLAPSQLRPLAVDALFAETRRLFAARLRAKGQSLSVASPGGLRLLGLPVIAAESVLGNLVSNAIKFSPQGAVIELDAYAVGGRVALRVGDRGPGLPPALLAELATEGPLPSSAGSCGEPGNGFGLKLVREHLQRMGGSLDIAPRPGGGTHAVAWFKAAPQE